MASMANSIYHLLTVFIWLTLYGFGAPAPTTSLTSPSSQTLVNEEAGKIQLFTLAFLITNLKDTTNLSGTALDDHCGSLDDDDFPPEFGKERCRDYAAYIGTSHVTCSRPISNPAIHNGADTSIQTTMIEVMDSLLAHVSMLKGLRDVPAYSGVPSCSSVTGPTSPDYFICKLKTTQDTAVVSRSVLGFIMNDLEIPAESRPADITCQADVSVEKKVPLGILWKIESDSKVHLANLRNTCETVKRIQGQTSFTCP